MNRIAIFVLIAFAPIISASSYEFRTISNTFNCNLHHIPQPKGRLTHVHELVLHTHSNTTLSAFHFDRNSDTVILLGQPFPSQKEKMLALANALNMYDVIIFDYRWKQLNSYSWTPHTMVAPVDRLMHEPVEDVNTLLNYIHNKKVYTHVIGLGQCYSAYTFTLAQLKAQEYRQLGFTKLILDSTWLSLKSFLKQIAADPWLPAYPQHGGGERLIKKILRISWIHKSLHSIACGLTSDANILEPISLLTNIPILFLHGKRDLIVPIDDFEQIWHATQTDKCALITTHAHLDNFHDINNITALCSFFIEASSIKEFEHELHNYCGC